MSEDDEPPELLDIDAGPPAGPFRPLDRRKVPLTLLTGYLGAGKSTLLQYVLTADHGYRIAVCMNGESAGLPAVVAERSNFGDTTDIEAKSLTLTDPLTGAQTSSLLSLPNGCLCCSFKDMGIAAIEEMTAQQGVDWVMVELTGVADPGTIAKSFWENEEMGDLILDGVVCVVDCRNVLRQLAEERPAGEINECQRQIACADVILLNKTDLVDAPTLASVESTIRSLNPTLRVHRTVQSRIPLEEIFNLRAFSSHDQALQSLDRTQRGIAPAPSAGPLPDIDLQRHDDERRTRSDHQHDHTCNHDDDFHSHLLHSSLSTTLIPLPPLSTEHFARLNSFLESLLWDRTVPPAEPYASAETAARVRVSPEVLRTKGYIILRDGREYILQGVTDLFEMREIPRSTKEVSNGSHPVEGLAGKVVFIGRGLERVRAGLLAYLGMDA